MFIVSVVFEKCFSDLGEGIIETWNQTAAQSVYLETYQESTKDILTYRFQIFSALFCQNTSAVLGKTLPYCKHY